MVHNVLIPQDAIQAFGYGNQQPTKLNRVQTLFSFEQACDILSKNADEVMALIKSKDLFAVTMIEPL